MLRQWKNPKFYLMILTDGCLFVVAHVAAYLFRFEFELDPLRIEQIKTVLPYLVAVKLCTFHAYGLYRGMWRYSSLKDFWCIAQACVLSVALVVSALLYLNRFADYSRAVFLIDAMLSFFLTGVVRIFIRYFYSAKTSKSFFQSFRLFGIERHRLGSKRLLIIGAGDAVEKMLREISDNPQLRYQVVGLLDDDPRKLDRTVHGVPVIGSTEELPMISDKYHIDEVFIAIPSATGVQMRRIVDICKSCNLPFKTLPGMGEIMDGRVTIKALRDVNYQDLLGREPVQLDPAGIRDYLADQVVLVTGCGGSIGSELCRQVARFQPRAMILVDASEANLFHIQMELHHEIIYRNYHTILAQVQDHSLMEKVFLKHLPSVVFHAAAYKHVPMLERNPWEAVFNNVLGSQVVMELAREAGVRRFVLVSTDKAVRPTNVMGASKRVTELFLQSLQLQGSAARFMAVRFGNVVGSSGSVIPLFRRQIEQGGPVTVTHPEVMRYFMTIPESAKLILQAGAMGEGGEIFILDMGTPVKIAEMAEDLIRLSGKEPGQDIDIIYTGLREGEKIYEELLTVGEGIVNTQHEQILVLRANNWQGFDSGEKFSTWLKLKIEELVRLALQHDAAAIRDKLSEIVPEYTAQNTESVL
jgi:FlaA1/EpsC-like NDP-sugar epimerase